MKYGYGFPMNLTILHQVRSVNISLEIVLPKFVKDIYYWLSSEYLTYLLQLILHSFPPIQEY